MDAAFQRWDSLGQQAARIAARGGEIPMELIADLATAERDYELAAETFRECDGRIRRGR